MLETLVMGRSLSWHPLEDPPGAWAYALDGESLAELWWSAADGEVRAEVGTEVWRIAFTGTFMLRGVIRRMEHDVPRLLFAGAPRRGLARSPEGLEFVLFARLDRKLGPWAGIDDEEGSGVLRIRGRIGGGGVWSDVSVTDDRSFAGFVQPLLLLWGGLQILRVQRPWLPLTTCAASQAAMRRELKRLRAAAAFSPPRHGPAGS